MKQRFSRHTKAVLTMVAVCLFLQADQQIVFASGASSVTREVPEAEFFDPSESTRYAGRLFSSSESYPLMEMRKLCEAHTGLDTAQVKCQQIEGEAGYICDYKCSRHWLVGRD